MQAMAASLQLPQPEENLGECQLNRALMFDDLPEKSDVSNGPAVSFQESSTGSCIDKSSSPEDDSSSAWSVQVHASSEKGGEEELGVEDLGEYTEEGEEWEEDSDDDCFDDLCEEMSRMTVVDEEEERGRQGCRSWRGSTPGSSTTATTRSSGRRWRTQLRRGRSSAR